MPAFLHVRALKHRGMDEELRFIAGLQDAEKPCAAALPTRPHSTSVGKIARRGSRSQCLAILSTLL